ncbi:MAG: LuxR C-terminal-related transcriptional regulator [Burkholderiales bacterium]
MAYVQPTPPLSLGSIASAEMLADLVVRCGRDDDLRGAFATIASCCGFDGFSYFLLADTAGIPTVLRHWTSACDRWQLCYAQKKHHALDPRIVLTRGRCVPMLWHAEPRAAWNGPPSFAADAARFGIRGGVAIAFDDARIGRVVLAWDSARERGDEQSVAVVRDPAHLMLIAGYLREAMLPHCHHALTKRPDAQLTPRERECVGYAARGMTSADIGRKLGITQRTVNFHFGNIMQKLGVLNRAEAIVRALALRLVPPV